MLAQFSKVSASGGTTAVASAESKGSGFCLALSARTGVSLPRIKVHVRGCSVPLRAAVDSCSHRSLIALEVAHQHDMSILQVATDCQPITAIDGNVLPITAIDGNVLPITAIDGNVLNVISVVKLSMSRDDQSVYLPEVTSEFLVVKSLQAVSVELLIGLDVISSAGGVQLEYEEKSGQLSSVVFGKRRDVEAAVAAEGVRVSNMPCHVTVTRDGSRVSLAADNGEAVLDPVKGYWEVAWKWTSGEPPANPVGSGVGEYFRRRLSDEQEAKFQKEAGLWQAEGWLVPYDADVHGPVGGVLPLIAVCQEHKLSTPIRPCLDYRELNKRIASRPGTEA